MARQSRQHTIQCYYCRHRFEVSTRTESTSCPKCHKALIVGDLIVKSLKGPLKEVRTCGHIEVQRRGRIIAEFIEAHNGINCLGVIESKRVLSGLLVTLGPKSQFSGDLTAPGLIIKNGARIHHSALSVPEDPLELGNLPAPSTKKPEPVPKPRTSTKASSTRQTKTTGTKSTAGTTPSTQKK